MLDTSKQIAYWKSLADDDIEVAEILINNMKYKQGLFFCHLTVEKILKALFVKSNKEIPPKTDDLPYLFKKSNIELVLEQIEFLQILMIYQLEGRYPDYKPNIPSEDFVKEYLI